MKKERKKKKKKIAVGALSRAHTLCSKAGAGGGWADKRHALPSGQPIRATEKLIRPAAGALSVTNSSCC